VLGYGISYGCYGIIPLWTYLIILTCMTVVAGVVCFFAFPLEQSVNNVTELNEEQPESPARAAAEPQAAEPGRIGRDGMPLGEIMNLTFTMYKKMLLILGVQITLGVYISYCLNLLEYLIWTTQPDPEKEKLIHNVDVILIFGGGAIMASIIVGMMCDWLSMKKMGFGVVVFNILVFVALYPVIFAKSLYITYLVYLFVGFALFSLVVWILCACSKIYGGKF
jgi:sugar phosphate permease